MFHSLSGTSWRWFLGYFSYTLSEIGPFFFFFAELFEWFALIKGRSPNMPRSVHCLETMRTPGSFSRCERADYHL